ncbi:hypothetical protein, partial [Pseudonocardia sp. TRM90224]|uniref:hypothetical protein n=1 Tax=Pseudonocardia sp. TRM90224 TaxID=2812678 RepID=UPI001E3C1F96
MQEPSTAALVMPNGPPAIAEPLAVAEVEMAAWQPPFWPVQAVEPFAMETLVGSVTGPFPGPATAFGSAAAFAAATAAFAPPSGEAADAEVPVTVPVHVSSRQSSVAVACVIPARPGSIGAPGAVLSACPLVVRVLAVAPEPTMQPFAPPVQVASARDALAVAGSASPFSAPVVVASAVVVAVHLLLAHRAVALLCDNVAGAPVTGFAASSAAFVAASPACFA